MKRAGKKLGLAFSEELLKVKPVKRVNNIKASLSTDGWEESFLPGVTSTYTSGNVSNIRLSVIGSIFLIIFSGLIIRLFHLQVITGQDNRVLADNNRIKYRLIHAPRGVIFDRDNNILAENNPGFRLEGKLMDRDSALKMEAGNDPNFENLEIDAIRFYPFGDITSHVLGYISEISEEELKDPKYENYKMGDRIGRTGIEQVYEEVLRGRDGAEIIEVDAQGKFLRALRKVEPVPGKNITLSLDVDLQKHSQEALQEAIQEAKSCCGIAVAMNPFSGEILSLVSLPSYDNNAFTDPKRREEINRYFEDQTSPLLNRVVAGTYPPGSTFKITSALAGLSSGKITPQTQFEDTGVLSLGSYQFANWYFTQHGQKEGLVNVIKALRRSNDIYFYKVGELLGEKGLGEAAKKLGMGKKLGIDLPGEEEGLVPDGEWKETNIGEVWYPGDSLHMAIGQGYLLITPLQVLAQTSYIAAEGKLLKPYLVDKVVTSQGSVLKRHQEEVLAKDIYKKEDVEIVKKGLEEVTKTGGTAWPFFNFLVPTAGKTGTAEFGDSKGKTHAWYTSFAPVDNPKIAVTVLIEAGGEGSSIAAPVVKDIYTWYFNTDKKDIKSLDISPASDSAKVFGE